MVKKEFNVCEVTSLGMGNIEQLLQLSGSHYLFFPLSH